MKTLYLVRHAKSSWDFPELTDIDRPLNKRGQRNAPEMGERLAKKGILPDLMLTSPAKRAVDTCREIAGKIGYPAEKIVVNKKIYHAYTLELLDIVSAQPNDINSLMLFGHNPGFTGFANKLCHVDIHNIPTSGIFCCTFDIETWEDVDFNGGEFVFFDYPKKEQNGQL